VLAAVVVACLGFSGVAQAAAPPDPNTVGTPPSSTELSHIELNGVLGTELTVAPGQDVKIKANWEDKNTGCPTCLDFVATAFAGNPVAGCIENEGRLLSKPSGSGEVDLGPAPKAPGTYNVVALFEEANECGEKWNASESTGYQVIARVTVPSSTPTTKQECKKGGWRTLVDSNGKRFKNQGQCVRFVNANSAPEGAQKAPLFGPEVLESGQDCMHGGAAQTPNTFGFAVLDTPGNEATVTGVVVLKNAAPDATFQVDLEQFIPPASCKGGQVGTIATNKQGNGNLEFTASRSPKATEFDVLVFTPSLGQVLGTPNVKLD
jgi:hypothetical protein